MIAETQCFFIDILKLTSVNESSVLLIQAPYEELSSVFKKLSFKDDGVFQHIILKRNNVEILLFEIIFNDLDGYIQSLEIIVNGKKVFEGYDGMEYGVFSKDFVLPEEFKEKYVRLDMCLIAQDW